MINFKKFQITDTKGFLAYKDLKNNIWIGEKFDLSPFNIDKRITESGKSWYACTMASNNNNFVVLNTEKEMREYVESQNDFLCSNERVKEYEFLND